MAKGRVSEDGSNDFLVIPRATLVFLHSLGHNVVQGFANRSFLLCVSDSVFDLCIYSFHPPVLEILHGRCWAGPRRVSF